MKVMGIRTSNAEVRYAVLEKTESGNIVFCNQNENRLPFPKDLKTDDKKLGWFFDEFHRLLGIYRDISKVVIKLPEFGFKETNASRLANYLDAAVFLGAGKHNPPIACLGVQYRSLHTRRSGVLEFVSSKGIPKTSHYWNVAMGDAIAAALSEME